MSADLAWSDDDEDVLPPGPRNWTETRAVVLYRDGYLCQICRDAPATEVDHVWPRRMGGTDDLDNLQAACVPCNRQKGGAAYLCELTEARALWPGAHYLRRMYRALEEVGRWWAIGRLIREGVDPEVAYDKVEAEGWRDYSPIGGLLSGLGPNFITQAFALHVFEFMAGWS